MATSRTLTLVGIFLLLAASVAAQEIPRLVVDPEVDQEVNLNLWWNTLKDLLFELRVPSQQDDEILVHKAEPGTYNTTTNNEIFLQLFDPPFTDKRNDPQSPRAPIFWHELGHVLDRNNSGDGWIAEGTAEGGMKLLYRKAYSRGMTLAGKRIPALTGIFMADTLNNLPREIGGGGWTPAFQNFGGTYIGFGGLMELLVNRCGGDFTAIDLAFRNTPTTREENLAIFDQTCEPIDGMLPSAFLLQSPTGYINGKEGRFFGGYANSPPLFWDDKSFQNYAYVKAPVNPTFLDTRFQERSNRETTLLQGWVQYTIYNASGDVVVPATNFQIPANSGQFAFLPNLSSLPEGAYRIHFGVLRGDKTVNPELSDTCYFIRTDRLWTRDKILIITNGPVWGDLKSTQMELVGADPRVTLTNLPGLAWIELNGATSKDIRVREAGTGSNKVRTITPDWDVTRIIHWTRRTEESIGIASATGDLQDTYAPGGFISIYGKYLAGYSINVGDFPLLGQAYTLPFPTKLGFCRVLINGVPAPMQWAVTWTDLDQASQLNVQIPFGTLPGKAEMVVERFFSDWTLDHRFEPVYIQIKETAPNFFGTTNLPVLLQNFTQDPTGGTFVSEEAPANPGDWLVTYSAGWGRTDPPTEDGDIPKKLATANVWVEAWVLDPQGKPAWKCSIGGNTVFASPQFAGVYQMNIQLPETVMETGPQGQVTIRVFYGNEGKFVDLPAYVTAGS